MNEKLYIAVCLALGFKFVVSPGVVVTVRGRSFEEMRDTCMRIVARHALN